TTEPRGVRDAQTARGTGLEILPQDLVPERPDHFCKVSPDILCVKLLLTPATAGAGIAAQSCRVGQAEYATLRSQFLQRPAENRRSSRTHWVGGHGSAGQARE